MKLLLIVLLAKLISLFSRLFNLGAGGTWPGEVALFLDKNIFFNLASLVQEKIILVAGTNGKTTTAKIVAEILKDKDLKTLRNEGGGNVLNGLTSTLILNANLKGEIKANWIIFEVDEATLPIIVPKIKPKIVVLLNLFRDQLDRYGEVDILAEKWKKALLGLPKETVLVLNADDPQIAVLGKDLPFKVKYFGLENEKFFLKKTPCAMDSLYCPLCSEKLYYEGFYMAHLGNWRCLKCGLKKPKLDIKEEKWKNYFSLSGVYNRYNILAAILVGKILGVNEKKLKKVLKSFQPAFGRQEEFKIKGRKVKILLSKNPTGMNEAIRTMIENLGLRTKDKKNTLLVLNDRIPDGRDVSWIWDVDTKDLVNSFQNIIVSGDRAYDMGLRIKYSNKQIYKYANKYSNIQINKFQIIENLKQAIYYGIKETPMGETFYILPTYSAMLEVRKILVGRKIL